MEAILPKELSFQKTNIAEAWTKWQKKLKIYLRASQKIDESDVNKITILLNLYLFFIVFVGNILTKPLFSSSKCFQISIFL